MTPSSEPPALASHLQRFRRLAGVGRKPQPRGFVEGAEERLQRLAAGAERLAQQDFVVRRHQAVEEDQDRRGLDRELADAALGRMQAHLQGVEGQRVAVRDRELAVDHEAVGRKRAQYRRDLGEVARQRLAGFRPEIDLVAGPEGEAAEAVPFRLELPAGLARQIVDELRLHRRRADRDRQRGEAGGLPGASTCCFGIATHPPETTTPKGRTVRSARALANIAPVLPHARWMARSRRTAPCPRSSDTSSMTTRRRGRCGPVSRPTLSRDSTGARRRSRRRAPGSCRS